MDPDKREIWRNLLYEKPPSRKQAREIQKELREKVIREDDFNEINTVAGVDLSLARKQKKLICGVILFSYPELEEIETVSAISDETFPYVPGLLSFREGPAIVEALSKLETQPDLLIIDGHGIAHPRGLGIASHIGVISDVPSIGVAKKKLYGQYNDPEEIKGDWSPLIDMRKLETIGGVLRTKKKTKPVFVSTGHKVNLKTAIKIVLECGRGYKLPEPTRKADILVAELKKKVVGNNEP